MLVSPLLAAVLLGGCISISLTNAGTLEFSHHGIQVVQGDEEDKEAEKNEVVDTDTTDKELGKGGVVEDDEEEFLTNEGFGGCDNEFYLLQN